MTARLAALLLISLAVPLSTASAQERTPTPSANELWKSYPLQTHPTQPTPQAPQAPAAQPARSTPAPQRRAQSGPPLVPLLLLGVVLGLAAVAVPELRRRREDAATPLPEPKPEPDRPRTALTPPNPHRVWTAAIEWHETRFRVTTRPPGEHGRVLAESGPLPWPPADAAAVQALNSAVHQLEAALLAAGWRALPPGREWYAKRFAWEPVGARRPARPRGRTPAHAR